MQAGTTPKKRTSLNGRAAQLMRRDGARRADQAASDARMTRASSSIAVALLLISSGASATECQSSAGHDGKWWSYRIRGLILPSVIECDPQFLCSFRARHGLARHGVRHRPPQGERQRKIKGDPLGTASVFSPLFVRHRYGYGPL